MLKLGQFKKQMLDIEPHCPCHHHAGNVQPWAYLSAGRAPVGG
jgi:hypothetical protein